MSHRIFLDWCRIALHMHLMRRRDKLSHYASYGIFLDGERR